MNLILTVTQILKLPQNNDVLIVVDYILRMRAIIDIYGRDGLKFNVLVKLSLIMFDLVI